MKETIGWILENKIYECELEEGACPFCGLFTVVALHPPLAAKETDGTTHVCHPGLGGCNHGFEKTTRAKAIKKIIKKARK